MKKRFLALAALLAALLPCQAYASTTQDLTGVFSDPSVSNVPLTANVPMSTTVDPTPEYTITLPVNIDIGRDLSASYTVTVKGVAETDKVISLKPDTQVTMTSDSKSETVDVYQPKTRWSYNDITAEGGTSIVGTVNAERLTEGTWTGNLQFTIALQQVAFIPDADDGISVTWEEMKNLDYITLWVNGNDSKLYCYKGSKINNLPEGTLIIPDSAGVQYLDNQNYSSAFYYMSNLTNVIIPSTVTWIDEACFKECKNLKSVKLSSNLTGIAASAFLKCISLTDIVIPNKVKSIRQQAFDGCTSLTSINIPASCTTIGSATFRNTGITSIEVPDSVTVIGENAFEGIDTVYYSGIAGGAPWGANKVLPYNE